MCLPAENSWVTCIYVHTTHTTQFTSIYWYVYIINYVYIYIYTEISLRRESERILLLTVENIQSILLIAKVYLDSHTNPSKPTDAHNHKRRMREHQRRLRQHVFTLHRHRVVHPFYNLKKTETNCLTSSISIVSYSIKLLRFWHRQARPDFIDIFHCSPIDYKKNTTKSKSCFSVDLKDLCDWKKK